MQGRSAGITILKRIGWTFVAVEAGALGATAIVFLLAAVLGVLAAL